MSRVPRAPEPQRPELARALALATDRPAALFEGHGKMQLMGLGVYCGDERCPLPVFEWGRRDLPDLWEALQVEGLVPPEGEHPRAWACPCYEHLRMAPGSCPDCRGSPRVRARPPSREFMVAWASLGRHIATAEACAAEAMRPLPRFWAPPTFLWRFAGSAERHRVLFSGSGPPIRRIYTSGMMRYGRKKGGVNRPIADAWAIGAPLHCLHLSLLEASHNAIVLSCLDVGAGAAA